MALFKNLPSEDTPINARNLSRSERYLEAVAGANGDFYVDIDGADGLEAGDILRIAFPAATNGASNARLSIAGASGTFRDMKNSVGYSCSAANLQERYMVFYYNGTHWIKENNTAFKSMSVNIGASASENIPELRGAEEVFVYINNGAGRRVTQTFIPATNRQGIVINYTVANSPNIILNATVDMETGEFFTGATLSHNITNISYK